MSVLNWSVVVRCTKPECGCAKFKCGCAKLVCEFTKLDCGCAKLERKVSVVMNTRYIEGNLGLLEGRRKRYSVEINYSQGCSKRLKLTNSPV